MTYELVVVREEYNHDIDKKIQEVIGQSCHSAGYGFGERDMQFSFDTEEEADAAVERLGLANLGFEFQAWIDVWDGENEDEL